MATTRDIKRRIGSIKNTKKITKAMELIAASKMRQAVDATTASRVYAQYAWNILQALEKNIVASDNYLLAQSKNDSVLYLVITANRGLCGAYNHRVTRSIRKKLQEADERGIQATVITVGTYGERALTRAGYADRITASFADIPEKIKLKDIHAIIANILEKLHEQTIDTVYVAYTEYKSALKQETLIRQIAPIEPELLYESIEALTPENKKAVEKGAYQQAHEDLFDFEPTEEELLPVLAERLITMQIYQMFLESRASEHAARMMAMKNASDSASDMIDELTLMFNKARQAAITKEISEVSSGMAATE